MSTNHLNLLGCKAKDRITGLTGIITTISYDLYGCIQATMTQKANTEGVYNLTSWMDVTRFEILDYESVIERPNFDKGYVAEGKKGSAEKPALM